MKHFTKSKEKLFEEFNSSYEGLSSNEVKLRVEKYGKNIFEEKEKDSLLKIFLNQFKDSLVIILLIASLISFFLK